mmetsp:Transcript_27805/g.50718  ORF Transcript_27805/g.50718 Transcript_27805/m.50718 type:complete len:229 (+) Transcript_27805:842-1528(+)
MVQPLFEWEVQYGLLSRDRHHVEDDEDGSAQLAMDHDLSVQHGPRLHRREYVTKGILLAVGILPARLRLERLHRLVARPIHQHRRRAREHQQVPHAVRLLAEEVPVIAALHLLDIVPREVHGHAPDEVPRSPAIVDVAAIASPPGGDGGAPALALAVHELPDGAALADGELGRVGIGVLAQELVHLEDVVRGIQLLDHEPQLLRQRLRQLPRRGVLPRLNQLLRHGRG